jgi:predicted DNA-binding protein
MSSAFSRNGTTTAEGKCDSRVDIPVPAALEEKLIALAVMAGRPRAEYARMLLTKGVEGELAYLRSVGSLPALGDGNNGGSQ